MSEAAQPTSGDLFTDLLGFILTSVSKYGISAVIFAIFLVIFILNYKAIFSFISNLFSGSDLTKIYKKISNKELLDSPLFGEMDRMISYTIPRLTVQNPFKKLIVQDFLTIKLTVFKE